MCLFLCYQRSVYENGLFVQLFKLLHSTQSRLCVLAFIFRIRFNFRLLLLESKSGNSFSAPFRKTSTIVVFHRFHLIRIFHFLGYEHARTNEWALEFHLAAQVRIILD